MKYTVRFIFILVITASCTGGLGTSSQYYQKMHSSPEGQALVQKGALPGSSTEPVDINKYVGYGTNPPGSAGEACIVDTTRQMKGGIKAAIKNFTALGGSREAIMQAICFQQYHYYNQSRFNSGEGKIRIKEKCLIKISDFTLPGNRKRGFLVNICTGETKVYANAHSTKTQSDGGFTNEPKSKRTPRGFFITGGDHTSASAWSPGIILNGIQKGVNHYAARSAPGEPRGVVLHKGTYAAPATMVSSPKADLSARGSGGGSWGCNVVAPGVFRHLQKTIKGDDEGGTLVYNYSPTEKSKGGSYCPKTKGESLWM